MSQRNRPASIMATLRDQDVSVPKASQNRPNSLVGSALLLSGPRPPGKRRRQDASATNWQGEAWDMFDRISELRSGSGWIANAMGSVNLTVAKAPEHPGDDPIPADPDNPVDAQWIELIKEFGGGITGQGQILNGIALQLSVPGIGYVYGRSDEAGDWYESWHVLSTDEVEVGTSETKIANPDTGEMEPLGEYDLLVQVWRSHPRWSWVPDSPVKALLPVLREIDYLTSRAQVEARSRLLGNGILFMPNEAQFVAVGDDQNGTDPFIENLLKTASMAIENPDDVAAGIPIVSRLPKDLIETVRHMTFWTDLDNIVGGLRDNAIRRLALGLDMPPEVLLGLGDTNHWSAWQIEESAIKLHIEPLAELVAHALTIGYLRPAALALQMPDVDKWMVWYDTVSLQTRPDLTPAANEAHSRGVITDDAYLRLVGLDVGDMPLPDKVKQAKIAAIVQNAPSLAPDLLPLTGLVPPDWVPASAAASVPAESTAPAEPEAAPVQGPPERQPEPSTASVEPLIEACDALVWRALEVAGRRLGAAISRSTKGATAVDTADPITLHTRVSATEYASVDHLLEGAWSRVPAVAARRGVDGEALRVTLDSYVGSLLATGHGHDIDHLRRALGA